MKRAGWPIVIPVVRATLLRFHVLAPLTALVVCGASAARANILEFLFRKPDIQVITVTDATPAGALLRPASPDNPVYYNAINAGYRELGGIVAGEKVPPQDQVLKNIATVLARHGYLPATRDHPPTLLMIWTWGTMNVDYFPDPSGETMGRQINRRQLMRFMGGDKVGLVSSNPSSFQDDFLLPGLTWHTADSEAIADAATDDIFIAAISAYDFRAATQGEKKKLWTTKISCPSRRLSLPETLPTMLAIAGPFIGRETAKPVWINASDKYKPDVKIGDPSVVEYLEPAKLPVVNAESAAPKKAPAPARKKK